MRTTVKQGELAEKFEAIRQQEEVCLFAFFRRRKGLLFGAARGTWRRTHGVLNVSMCLCVVVSI
jgi:hypothetical protein